MADIFLFSSPRKPSEIDKRCLCLRCKARSFKKSRFAKMDILPQHACMARFDEPTFCPSDISGFISTLPRGSLLDDGYLRRDSATVTQMDEPFGRTRPQSDGLEDAMVEAFAEAHIAGFHPSIEQHTAGQSLLASPQPRPLVSSILGSSHQRPLSPETWEEEDRRRLRFALNGIDTTDIPQFQTPEDLNTPTNETEFQVLSSVTQQPTLSQSEAYHGNTNALHLFSDMVAPIEISDSSQRSHGRRNSSPYDETFMDDDAMAVDDRRRSYDFFDFLDKWQTLSTLTKRLSNLPVFKPGEERSVRLWRPPDRVSRKDIDNSSGDMQGIPWHLIGPSRKDTLKARMVLRPPNCHARCLADALSCSGLDEVDTHSHYQFRNFVPKHRAHFTHYQLRNMLAANSRSDLFYSTGNKINKTSLSCPSHKETLVDLSNQTNGAAAIRITCVAASSSSTFPHYRSDSVLLAGGFCGEYALLNLGAESGTRHHEGLVTHAYNGLVTHACTFHDRRSGLVQAAFCSNDCKLRLLDTRNLRFTITFSYDNAINCSATSPDGRLRALVGDSSSTLITDAEKGDVLVTLNQHTDHGFACAWSHSGLQLATGAQDSRVLIWDARNWTAPLHILPSVMSCPRSLHYTADDSALVVAEQDDVVSIFDTQDCTRKQHIRFFGPIAGTALLDGGAELAVANADETVGGLLTFQRVSQGRNGGSFGEIVRHAKTACWGFGEEDSNSISDVMV